MVFPSRFSNTLSAKTYGAEVAVVWQMKAWWRWDVNYSWLHTQYNDNTHDVYVNMETPVSPEHKILKRSSLSVTPDVDLDLWFRYIDTAISVGSLGTNSIKSYVNLDMRAAWRAFQGIEISVVEQNLLAQQHLEYIAESQTLPTAIERGIYGKISWNF